MGEARWERFSTETVPLWQRVRRWNDYGSETLCSMTVDPCDRESFNATLSRIEFGPLGLVSMTSTGATARGDAGAGPWAGTERDALLLILSECGHTTFGQSHRTMELSPGDLLIRDLNTPWIHASTSDMNMLMVKMPYSVLLSRMDDPARLQGVNLTAREPAAAFTAEVIRAIYRTLNMEPHGRWNRTLADVMLDSVGMIYESIEEADRGHNEPRRHAAIRRDAKSYIARHLDDPDLSVAMVSQALGLGPRKLQRAFTEAGETPSECILRARLDLAARKLGQPAGARRESILDIALSVGFNDASHFSRSFSRRFGVPPRSYRGTPPRWPGAGLSHAGK